MKREQDSRRGNPSPQETVAFGDVTVEDGRNLTTNNARKLIRLAQCQVEYLLHVQETLVHHKERLRRVAEHAQRWGCTCVCTSCVWNYIQRLTVECS